MQTRTAGGATTTAMTTEALEEATTEAMAVSVPSPS